MSPESQIPTRGPLSVLTEEAWTGVSDNLRYGGEPHLRKCFRIPIDLLHFNIENGRYRTKFLLLKRTSPDATIDPTQEKWKDEILKLLNGTWEHRDYPVGTKKDREYFLQLVEDIRERDQERSGIVLETGGVMSGNRRLAALMHLYSESQNERFRFFKAFIVPGEASVTPADIWHLEMAAQQAQARLVRDYEPIEKLLKIQEGVECCEALNPQEGRSSAIRAVAIDFGVKAEKIIDELNTLSEIEKYLRTIGHPEEWWLAEGLTEVFTEFSPLREACETHAMQFEHRSKLIKTVYNLIKNGEADHFLIRDIRTTIGPVRRRRGARRMPSVTRILIDNPPSTATLQQDPTRQTKATARQLKDRFQSVYDANKEQEAPLTKAERAEENLKKLVELLNRARIEDNNQVKKLVHSLEESAILVNNALRIIRPNE